MQFLSLSFFLFLFLACLTHQNETVCKSHGLEGGGEVSHRLRPLAAEAACGSLVGP